MLVRKQTEINNGWSQNYKHIRQNLNSLAIETAKE